MLCIEQNGTRPIPETPIPEVPNMETSTRPDRRLPSSWHMPRRPALIAAGLCWAGFVLLALMMEGGFTLPLDRAGLLLWRNADMGPLGPAFVSEAARDVTALGGTSLRLLAAILAVVVMLRLQRRLPALFVGVAMAGGLLANTLLKLTFLRPRPDFLPHLTEAGGSSFPSGHSFGAATILLALALVGCGFTTRPASRRLLITGALALSLSVAWTRVWLGVHFPSDVIAGWLGGIGWTLLLATVIAPATEPGTGHRAG